MEKNTGFLGKILGRKKKDVDPQPVEPVPSEQPVFAGDPTSDVDPSVTKEEIKDALLEHCKNGGVVPIIPVPEVKEPVKHECKCGGKCGPEKCSCGHKHKHRDPFIKGPRFSSTSPASKRQKAQRKARRRNRRK